MSIAAQRVGSLPKGILTFIGLIIITLAVLSFVTSTAPGQMMLWAQKVFGWGFMAFYLGLVAVSIYGFTQLASKTNIEYWHEVGQQSANGIATLALTFTLLGISLGIGTLSEQSLSPDTIDVIIADLTRQFSTAFMTTVVGLPTSTLIRAAFGIRYQRYSQH